MGAIANSLSLARYLADLGALAASEGYRDVPVIFHTDHIKGPDTVRILGGEGKASAGSGR